MGDLIELRARIAEAVKDEQGSEIDLFLLREGLDLLADFRAIKDPAVRDSIRQMIARIAAALNPT